MEIDKRYELAKRYDDLNREDKDFVDSMYSIAISLSEFHERFKLFRHLMAIPPTSTPAYNSGLAHRQLKNPQEGVEHMRVRLPLMMEEIGEHAKDLNTGSFDGAVEEMADVLFVVMGSLYTAGETADLMCEAVSSKNDNKIVKTHYVDESGKVARRES